MNRPTAARLLATAGKHLEGVLAAVDAAIRLEAPEYATILDRGYAAHLAGDEAAAEAALAEADTWIARHKKHLPKSVRLLLALNGEDRLLWTRLPKLQLHRGRPRRGKSG